MTHHHSHERLKGSIPPVITPFTNGEVDYGAYRRLVEFQVDNGAGVDALLVVTPYYIRPPQRGLVEYYRQLATNHDTPWMIYHIPGRAAVSVTLDTLSALKDQFDHFVGMKHAVNDLGFVSECLNAFGADFKIFVGLEELSFPEMAIGACGLMNAVGNLRPRPLADICQAVWDPIPIKYMMRRMGLLSRNEHRPPMMPATAELERRLDGVLERAGLLPASAA